jgi:dipeptidyl aminopeptidase/acylaminoacyl peptidase
VVLDVRGGSPNRQGEIPNPALSPQPPEQAIFAVEVGANAAPRRLATGSSPAVSRSGQVAYLSRGQVWTVDLAGTGAPAQLFAIRGSARDLRWSPDGTKLAFVSARGDHSFVGVYDVKARSLRYLDPSIDLDGNPSWSPDGTRLAFTRIPATRENLMFSPRRDGVPWSIRVAHVETGDAVEVWRAEAGYGSVFQGVSARDQLMWGSGDIIVFPWERDGWLHLYSVPGGGGRATLLTPGPFEVEHAALSPDRTRVIYSSNQEDLHRRHLWSVLVDGRAPPSPLTRGSGAEWMPAPVDDATVVYFASTGRVPAHARVHREGEADRALQPLAARAPAFPTDALVEPQPVTITAADGMEIPAQIFLPRDLAPGEKRPAVIFFHGGSRRQMLLAWHYLAYYHNTYAMNQYLASRGYVVLSVNYRSGTGYGLEFREALNYGATGASEFQDVIGAGLYLKSRPDVDPERIGVYGGSYGGYLTAHALARASDLFAAGVDIHGVHDWNVGIRTFRPDFDPEPEIARRNFLASPLAYVDGWRSPVLLIHGDDDRNVSFSETVTLAEQLRRRGVEIETLVLPDEVHGFLRHDSWLRVFEAAAEFFDRRLKGSEATSSAR